MLLTNESEQITRAALTNFTKSSSVPQLKDDFQSSNGFMITAPDRPLTFQKVGRIRKITNIRITATLYDAETGLGELNENQLTLALDGIDTGILLNGFLGNFPDDVAYTRTISGVPINEAQIRAALKADGKLDATIIDHTPDPPSAISGHDENRATLVLRGKQRG
jgi:hypothetical protein